MKMICSVDLDLKTNQCDVNFTQEFTRIDDDLKRELLIGMAEAAMAIYSDMFGNDELVEKLTSLKKSQSN